jgi:hypothetical protein
VLFPLFLLSLSSAAFAESPQPDGMVLIHKGVELTDLSQSGPYHMHTLLSVRDKQLNKQIDGGEDVYWVSAKQWRRELRLKDYYSESAFILDSQLYRLRRPSFTPPAGRRDIVASLRSLPEAMEYSVVRVFDRSVDGSAAHCVLLRKAYAADINWCFDATSGLPMVEYFRLTDTGFCSRATARLAANMCPGQSRCIRPIISPAEQ